MGHMNSNGNNLKRWEDEEHVIQTDLNPFLLVQLQMLQGKTIQGLALWQSSIADEELAELEGETVPENRVFVDFDLYLEDQTLLEIYAATIYRDADDDPIIGLGTIAQALGYMAEQGAVLSQVTMDEDDGLVLILATGDDASLIIAPSGWSLGHWDELPGEEIWDA